MARFDSFPLTHIVPRNVEHVPSAPAFTAWRCLLSYQCLALTSVHLAYFCIGRDGTDGTGQMSQDSSLVPKAVDDIPETKLRELAGWFRARAVERRRLLKRYRAGRLKTEALAARKQVCGTWMP